MKTKTKHPPSRFIILALGLFMSLQLCANTNLILNPSFETQPISDNWFAFANGGDISASTAQAHNGNYSVFSENRNAHYVGPTQDILGKLSPGVNYTISAWVRLKVPDTQIFSIFIKQTDNNGTDYIGVNFLTVKSDNWVKLSGMFHYQPNGNVTNLSIYVNGPDSNVDFYVDDVSITPPLVYTPTPSSPDDFIRAKGHDLVVGTDEHVIRLIGTNFTAYADEDEPVSVIFNGKHYDEIDYQRVADMGMNVVRLNLWWKVFEDENNHFSYKSEGWEWLEKNIIWARNAGVYLILDMHAPQGGFQGPGYDGNFWNSSDKKNRMKALWVAIAERYKDEPFVAAYDIFNEPDPKNQQQWVEFAQELINAIRVIDNKHLFIVEMSMNDDAEPFLVSDNNVQYDAHFYAPWRFSSQLIYHYGYGDYGSHYPDPEISVIPWDWKAGDLMQNSPIPTGSSNWTWYEGKLFTVNDTNVFGAIPTFVSGKNSGKIYFDDFTVKEYDENGDFVREISSIDLEKRPSEWYLLTEYEPFLSFTEYWKGQALNGSGSKQVENTGHSGNNSFSIRNVTGKYLLQNWRLMFAVKQGHSYQISGWIKGENVTNQSGGLALQWQKFESWDTPKPFTKNYLEQVLLEDGLQFYLDHNVPMNVGEFGQSVRNFQNGRGGLEWVTDMLALFQQYGISGQYFNYHSTAFGIYSNLYGFPDPDYANLPLIDLFRSGVTPTPPTPIPVAKAGVDQVVDTNNQVSLNGDSSTGTINSYQWTQVSGETVVLQHADTVIASFTAPANASVLTFRLTVTGPGGSNQDNINVTVNEVVSQESTDLSLSIKRKRRPKIPAAGDNLTIILTARNEGTENAKNVTLVYNLDEDAEFVSASRNCILEDEQVFCNLGKIMPGKKKRRKIVINAEYEGMYYHNSQLGSSTPDPDISNNSVGLEMEVFEDDDYGIEISKEGKGRVISKPRGIRCGSRCDKSYPAGTVLTLRAKPRNGYHAQWDGICENATETCTFTVRDDEDIEVEFISND